MEHLVPRGIGICSISTSDQGLRSLSKYFKVGDLGSFSANADADALLD